eukprot:COSAG02_NODE_6575_length_3485_cov_19.926757_2_plen_63_part_00
MVALKSTSSHCPVATPLHQPTLHYLSEGLTGSNKRPEYVEQLQLLVWRPPVGRDLQKIASTS